MTMSIFFFGAMVGAPIFGFLADKLGRAKTVIAANAGHMLTGSLTPFCKSDMDNKLFFFSILKFAFRMIFFLVTSTPL